MPGRINRTLEEFDLAFPAGCTSPAGGIDVNSRLHGGLKKVSLFIARNFSLTGIEIYFMLRHYITNYNPVPPRFRWRRDWVSVLSERLCGGVLRLEEPRHFACIHININPSVGRVRTGPWHQADRPRHRAEKIRPSKDQDVTNRQNPTLGYSLLCWIVCQTQVGLDHHGIEILQGWVSLEPFCFGLGLRGPGNTIRPVHLFGNCLNPFSERHLQRVEEFDVRFFFASVHDDVSK